MFRIARPQRRVLVRTTVGLFAAASLVLTGCGAGQYAQSVNEQAAMLGANGKVGDLSPSTSDCSVRRARSSRRDPMRGFSYGSPMTASTRTTSPG